MYPGVPHVSCRWQGWRLADHCGTFSMALIPAPQPQYWDRPAAGTMRAAGSTGGRPGFLGGEVRKEIWRQRSRGGPGGG